MNYETFRTFEVECKDENGLLVGREFESYQLAKDYARQVAELRGSVDGVDLKDDEGWFLDAWKAIY